MCFESLRVQAKAEKASKRLGLSGTGSASTAPAAAAIVSGSSSITSSSTSSSHEWVVHQDTSRQLHRVVAAHGVALVLTDAMDTVHWLTQRCTGLPVAVDQDPTIVPDEVAQAVNEFHARTGLNADLASAIGSSMPSQPHAVAPPAAAASPVLPRGLRRLNSSATIGVPTTTTLAADRHGEQAGSAGRADSGPVVPVRGWKHVATLTLPALLKLHPLSADATGRERHHRFKDQTSRRRSAPMSAEPDAALAALAEVADEDDEDELHDGQDSRRLAAKVTAHEVLAQLPAVAGGLVRALAACPSVHAWQHDPHRAHTKVVVLQSI
jgi:hypothetical protein